MGPITPAPPTPERSADSGGRVALRLLLVVIGFLLVWLMEDRWRAAREAYAASFEWPMGPWLLLVGAGVLAGMSFGLACSLPTRFGGYRWGRALAVGIPPLMILGLGIVFLADLESVNDLPRVLADLVLRLIGAGGPFFQPIAAVLLGIAVASGFGEPRPRVAPAGGFGDGGAAPFDEASRQPPPVPPGPERPADELAQPLPPSPAPPEDDRPWQRPGDQHP